VFTVATSDSKPSFWSASDLELNTLRLSKSFQGCGFDRSHTVGLVEGYFSA